MGLCKLPKLLMYCTQVHCTRSHDRHLKKPGVICESGTQSSSPAIIWAAIERQLPLLQLPAHNMCLLGPPFPKYTPAAMAHELISL